ncbi:hypothetical protein LTR56_022913 [Elasticomyces elasticus]|nr:hypothetical protein LTR56_022913 [Elasticomyces elasticus]KAK3627071.1 hypothetical protein LTR22_022930 [Elasticomyces elasticus]KAK4907493.1 hypothetical protein LTR49_023517 [Elasticomyces elasticus]KAK5747860.1 hypothetical protein LTS12_022058 [Elasticomyces elasticus]
MAANEDSPIAMSANMDGPMDPRDFYNYTHRRAVPQIERNAAPVPQIHASGGSEHSPLANRAFSRSPVRRQLRAVTDPVGGADHALNSVRSNPVLLPSRQPGSVKNIANKFDQGVAAAGGPPALKVQTQERHRRPLAKSAIPKSPVGASGSRGESGMVKLQKRRPGQPRSPQKSPVTSFETSSSLSSNATITSAKSQPPPAANRRDPKSPIKTVPYATSKPPLFGELTADGWHGNFELSSYGPLGTLQLVPRRQSDGNIALGHGRSQSQQDVSRNQLSPPAKQKLHHKRSRSEMDAFPAQPAPSMPNLNGQNIPALYPTPPNSGTRNTLRKDSPTSRIPVSSRRQSHDSSIGSDSYSRSASAMSNGRGEARNRLSKSPTRVKPSIGKENATPATPRSRYQPPPVVTSQSNQTLSAKIVAPPAKTSPPLRSSRPRQPVSAATTSASRARAAERFQTPAAAAKDARRPSEQWLGKPYDPQKERTKRKIPELGKVDFAERRARIQKAISQNLEQAESEENQKTRSRRASEVSEPATAGAQSEALNTVDEHQAEELDRETEAIDFAPAGRNEVRGRGLSLDTHVVPDHTQREPEPTTAATEATEFEYEESPILGRPAEQQAAVQPEVKSRTSESTEAPPILLSAVAYRRPSIRPSTPPPAPVAEPEPMSVQSPSVLDNVRLMRQRSGSSASGHDTNFAEDSPADDSPSDIEERWGLGQSPNAEGSIQIMLDDDPTLTNGTKPWARKDETDYAVTEVADSLERNQHAFMQNGYTESPTDAEATLPDGMVDVTPRRQPRDDTLKPATYQTKIAFTASSESLRADSTLARAIDQYQTTGQVAPEILQYVQNHSVDLQRLSANGGSDALMIQNLLDSMLDVRPAVDSPPAQEDQLLSSAQYDLPLVTPDTPPDAAMATGTAMVFANDGAHDDIPEASEADFHEKIRKADEDWLRQQRGEEATLGAAVEDAPTPPPKDFGYTPRSSTGPNSATFPVTDYMDALRISTAGDMVLETQAADESVTSGPVVEHLSPPRLAPRQPIHAPPPPPPGFNSPTSSRLPFGMPDALQARAVSSERESNELSPRLRKAVWAPSESSRPSVDSQRVAPPSLPGAQSMSSFADSTRETSLDRAADSQTHLAKPNSPSPEYKRLMKRKHIIKELLDTENSYHQDLKIIEDIYKATVGDLVTCEDTKTLFGNCDEIERFSLYFYDELRKAVAPVYIPAKQMRWANKRGSYSTTQSDGTGQTSVASADTIDEEKDRTTTIGQCFLANLHRMDQVYGAYLKNHDAANQRLTALKNTPTVKCWLDECHNNASDITSAWDLDSLLVKPTQRVAKYPLMLQQLLESTSPEHPDYGALKIAAKDAVGMLTRINEAKKRADLVDQIINRKGKDTDVRSGIAKAFGRRTEKLKERVGIAEAFQDADFDELSHKFGGHFIRLQICMRDVQDYLHRIDKAMEQITNTAAALDLYTDVAPSSLPEIESKWRRYGQAIREIAAIAFPEHKAAVHKRVIQPMITCIKLHEGPQNAINNRKKRIVDYAKCKSIEKRGEKPDKKVVEASEMYEALNHQLKIELPQLYGLTGSLVQGCLNCFLDIQLSWYNMWERKLGPILEASEIPSHIKQIEPAFRPDYDIVKNRLLELAVCNGALLADSANFLSPTSTVVGDFEQLTLKRPSTLDGNSRRTESIGSESSPFPSLTKRHSSGYSHGNYGAVPPLPTEGRIRSNSSLSTRGTPMQTPASAMSANRPWSNVNTPTSSFSASRPSTANQSAVQQHAFQIPRLSMETPRSPRPASGQTYFTARPEPEHRFSGLFSSALPTELQDPTQPATPTLEGPDMQVMFVCASLFEFSIDKTRKEAGYPYLTYVQGEVFDVVAQKGELWLAKNQDDSGNALGWIWEQHFVILSQN